MTLGKSTLSDLWSRQWPAIEPLSEYIRYSYPSKHVRFYTLPDGKRYADNEVEVEIILSRHNALLEDLAGRFGKEIIVVVPSDISSTNAAPVLDIAGVDDLNLWKVVGVDPTEKDPIMKAYRQLYFKSMTWDEGIFNELLREVSEERVWGVIIAFKDLEVLYCPYDGGIDILFKSSKEKDDLAKKYADRLD